MNEHSKITKVEEIINELGSMQGKGTVVSIAERKTDSTVVFTISKGTKSGALKNGISPEEAVSFISKITNRKGLIRQRAVDLHRAVNDKNLESAYKHFSHGISTICVMTEQDVFREFLEFISKKTGETKVFDSAALTALHVALSPASKAESSKDQKGRADLLQRLYGVVSQNVIDAIRALGYNDAEFLASAKKHHFVHYPDSGKYRLSKGSGAEAFEKLKSTKARAVNIGDITFSPIEPHLVTYNVEEPADPESSRRQQSEFAIGHTARRGERAEDLELKAAKEFLRTKGFNDTVLARLSIANIKDQARELNWTYVPPAHAE
jgi:hypothetical protein